jgi:hypothetical protein
MRKRALEVDYANDARVYLAGAALAPSLAAIVGDLAAAHGGARSLAHWRGWHTAKTSSGIIPWHSSGSSGAGPVHSGSDFHLSSTAVSVLTVATAISGWVSQ